MRRAKTHLGRAGPIASFSSAVRRVLQEGERCGVRFQEHAEEGNWRESRLAKDNWLRGLHDRLQGGAARTFLALVLLGTVRMAFSIL